MEIHNLWDEQPSRSCAPCLYLKLLPDLQVEVAEASLHDAGTPLIRRRRSREGRE